MVYKQDGFEGQKLISLPTSVYKNAQLVNPLLSRLFITHIGYFPKATYHYRERKTGCADNIFIYCLKGKGWYVIGNKKYIVYPNQFIHLPATTEYMRYGADEDDPWTIYWVHYCGKDLSDFNHSLSITVDNGPTDIVFNEKALNIWNDMYLSLEMGYSRDNLSNANMCLYYFLATFLYPNKHLSSAHLSEVDMVTKTIHFMRSNIGRRVSVEEFSSIHYLSASHFSLLFKKSTGMSPGDYFIQLKMQKACQMLYNPSNRIKKVAYELGYNDPYYFSRIFKKFMGISPEKYRIIRSKSD
nr:AraC family transcriptional regulator [uncultured Pedobacter sp.]